MEETEPKKEKEERKCVNIGILGASWVATMVIFNPAPYVPSVLNLSLNTNDQVKVHSIAARDVKRAKNYASKWKIPTVHNSYAVIINHPCSSNVERNLLLTPKWMLFVSPEYTKLLFIF